MQTPSCRAQNRALADDSTTPEVLRETNERDRLSELELKDTIRTLFQSEDGYACRIKHGATFRVIWHFGHSGFRIQSREGKEACLSESSTEFLRQVRTELSRKKIDASSMTEAQTSAFTLELDVVILSKGLATSIIVYSDPSRMLWDKKLYHMTYMFVGLVDRLIREHALGTTTAVPHDNKFAFALVPFT